MINLTYIYTYYKTEYICLPFFHAQTSKHHPPNFQYSFPLFCTPLFIDLYQIKKITEYIRVSIFNHNIQATKKISKYSQSDQTQQYRCCHSRHEYIAHNPTYNATTNNTTPTISQCNRNHKSFRENRRTPS